MPLPEAKKRTSSSAWVCSAKNFCRAVAAVAAQSVSALGCSAATSTSTYPCSDESRAIGSA